MSDNQSDPSSEECHRRRFTRIFFDAETVLSQGEQEWSVQLIDISLQGILIRQLPGQNIDPDQPAEACIHLGGDIQIRMELRLANRDDDLLGFHCENIDLDSLTHLRRLVELNLGDTRLLERELSALEL